MEEKNLKQIITLTDGKLLTINGVNNILGFDEAVVLLETAKGKITVEGAELKIESLEKQGGNLIIRGEISGVYASSESHKKGIFSKIFGK